MNDCILPWVSLHGNSTVKTNTTPTKRSHDRNESFKANCKSVLQFSPEKKSFVCLFVCLFLDKMWWEVCTSKQIYVCPTVASAYTRDVSSQAQSPVSNSDSVRLQRIRNCFRIACHQQRSDWQSAAEILESFKILCPFLTLLINITLE